MLDWFHAAQSPDHADAALTGLRDAPGRSIFCYGAGYRTTNPSTPKSAASEQVWPNSASSRWLWDCAAAARQA